MKVASSNPSVLVVKDFSILPYFIGILFIAMGILLMIVPPKSNFLGGAWLPDGGVPLWYGIIVIVFGLIPIALYKSSVAVFDKSNNIFSIEWKGLVGKKREQYYLNQIKEIVLSVGIISTETRGQVRSGNRFTLFANMQDGSSITLGNVTGGSFSAYGMNLSGTMGKGKENTGKQIAQFLNVPFQEIRPLSVTEMTTAISQGINNQNNTNQVSQPITPPISQSSASTQPPSENPIT